MAGQTSPIGDILSKFSDFLGGNAEKTAIGISIGSSSIKLVELRKIKKNWKLLHFGIVQLPDDVIANREIVNRIGVVESIKTLLSQVKLQSKSVCTAVSGNSVIIKRMSIDVPKMSELQEQVLWEAEQYLPFDVSDVVMDFQVLSRSKDYKTDIVLVAVKKGLLESYMNCVTEAGLKPKIVDVDLFALINLFEANYPVSASEAVALVDFGASALKLAIVQNGAPLFTKESAMGGRSLTAEIQKHLSLSYVDAETLKVGGAQGGAIPQEVVELMGVAAENYAGEVKRAIDYYLASATGPSVSFILLSGGGAKLPNLSKIIEEAVGVPTQNINPFNAVSYDPAVFTQEYLAAIGPIAAVPIGLAMRMGKK